MKQEYFYVIEDTRNAMLYAGSRYGVGCHPDEFMKPDGYQTSSKKIKRIIDEFGLDVFVVRKLKPIDNAKEYETLFLTKVKAATNSRFYNRHENWAKPPEYGSPEFTQVMLEKYGVDHGMKIPEVRALFSKHQAEIMNNNGEAKRRGNLQSKTRQDPEWKATKGVESINKMVANKDHTATGQSISKTMSDPEWKATKGVESTTKRLATQNTAEWKATVGKEKAKKHSDIQLDPEWKARHHKTCPHCNKTVSPGNYTKWHGNNCKNKGN